MKLVIFAGAGLCSLLLIITAIEALVIAYGGTPIAAPDIPRGPHTMGQGPPLNFVVLGDSTTLSQGGEYAKGYATSVATFLAQTHTVRWANVGVSGARAADVAATQVEQAATYQPDVALVAVGANDVVHLTGVEAARTSLVQIIDRLRAANPQCRIVLTGAPDMGSVIRFPQPVRWYAGVRTKKFNAMVAALAQEKQIYLAPIAEKTGPVFRKHPELFAQDKFHPTTAGYELWTPVIIGALKQGT